MKIGLKSCFHFYYMPGITIHRTITSIHFYGAFPRLFSMVILPLNNKNVLGKKFISLQEANTGEMHPRINDICAGCHNNKEIPEQADEDRPNVLPSYYAALIQCYSARIHKGKQDNGWLHCT